MSSKTFEDMLQEAIESYNSIWDKFSSIDKTSKYDSDYIPECARNRIYSSILGKYINPNTGEIIEDEKTNHN